MLLAAIKTDGKMGVVDMIIVTSAPARREVTNVAA
jgi:hypothetical protein